MKNTIAAGAALVAAALLVTSIDAAAPKPKLPKRWNGTAQYTYTYNGEGRSVQTSMSASVALVPVRGWRGSYEVSTGTLEWDYTQKTSDGCTTTSSGSSRASKYLLTLKLQMSSPPRAAFSGSEGAVSAPVPATTTCLDGSSFDSTMGVENPFFMLTRQTAGFPVKASLTKIAGSLRRAQSGAVWTLRFSFVGKR